MEISELKNAATLLNRYYIIQRLWGLSNKILCIHVVKGATKLQVVKVEGPKKIALRMQGETFSLGKIAHEVILFTKLQITSMNVMKAQIGKISKNKSWFHFVCRKNVNWCFHTRFIVTFAIFRISFLVLNVIHLCTDNMDLNGKKNYLFLIHIQGPHHGFRLKGGHSVNSKCRF